MSLVIGDKRILNNNFTAGQTTSAVNNSYHENHDTVQLSNDANTLKNLPLNLSSSKIYEESNGFQFDFDFEETRFQNVSANGFYLSEEKNLSMRLKFYLEKTLYENGEEKKQKYEIEFAINYSGIEINSYERKIEKEDIYKFLNRIMNDLTIVLNDDKKNLSGIVFDKDDLQDLMQIGDEEIGKFLNEIILLIQTLAKIKKYNNPDAENVLFNPKRIKNEILETNQTKSTSIDFKMSVNKSAEK